LDWRYFLGGATILVVAVLGILKLQSILSLKGEIARQEAQIREGQEIWRRHPPLSHEQREDFKTWEKRLSQMLPGEKDIPSLLEAISRLARARNLMDVSFQTGDGVAAVSGSPPAPGSAVPLVVPPPPGSPTTPEGIKPIDSFPVKVSFMGDYREIAYFLAEVEKLPRLVTIQSIKVNRGIPLLPSEVILNGYYKNEGQSVGGK
jgi:Tfp pilus assembly protein PilO